MKTHQELVALGFRPYEFMMRWHADGKVGAHLQFIRDTDGQIETLPFHTDDFPAEMSGQIEKYVTGQTALIVSENIKMQQDVARAQAGEENAANAFADYKARVAKENPSVARKLAAQEAAKASEKN